MTLRIGIIAQNIRQVRPRGVARVARAFIEELVKNDEFDCYVISNPNYDQNSMIVMHYELKDYINHVPLDLTQYKNLDLNGVAVISNLLRNISEVVDNWRFPGRRLFRFERQCRSLGFTPITKFDVVLSFEAFEDVWDWPVETVETKFIGLLHDTIPFRIYEGPNGQPEHFYRTVGKFIARADHVICNSHSTENDAHAFYPESRGRTSVIHLGYVPPVETPAPMLRNNNAEMRIVMLGDMDHRKNPQGALQSLQFIAEKLPGRAIVLEIIGAAHQRSTFRVLEDEAKRFAEIRWLGYLPDAARSERLASGDVFLFPSLWEGFGIPILEAMDAGVPVVCSRLSSLPEVGGEFAQYIDDPYDPQTIADAVLAVLSLPAYERAKRVTAAREWARQFTWTRATGQLADLIKAVTARKKLQAP